MTMIKKYIEDKEGNQVLPITHFSAVKDSNGDSLEDILYTESTYDPTTYSGMGRKVLQKNMVSGVNTLTQDMMQATNTIYIIRYDFVLGEDIIVPANCILEFDGGSLSGAYTITGNNTGIEAGLVKIFSTDVMLAGSWNVVEAYPEWFGAKGDDIYDDSDAIQKCLSISSNLWFSEKTYLCNIIIDNPIHINGVVRKSRLRPYDSSKPVIKITDTTINSFHHIIENIVIDGQDEFPNQQTDPAFPTQIGVKFETTIQGSTVFNNVLFIRLEKGVYKSNGNFINTFNNCTFNMCNFGIYAVNGPHAHAGFDYINNCLFLVCFVGIYQNDTNGAADGIDINHCDFEAGLGIDVFLNIPYPVVNPISSIRFCHVEERPDPAECRRPTVIIDNTTYNSYGFYFVNSSILVENVVIQSMKLESSNVILTGSCSQYPDSAIIDKDSNSIIYSDNYTTNRYGSKVISHLGQKYILSDTQELHVDSGFVNNNKILGGDIIARYFFNKTDTTNKNYTNGEMQRGGIPVYENPISNNISTKIEITQSEIDAAAAQYGVESRGVFNSLNENGFDNVTFTPSPSSEYLYFIAKLVFKVSDIGTVSDNSVMSPVLDGTYNQLTKAKFIKDYEDKWMVISCIYGKYFQNSLYPGFITNVPCNFIFAYYELSGFKDKSIAEKYLNSRSICLLEDEYNYDIKKVFDNTYKDSILSNMRIPTGISAYNTTLGKPIYWNGSAWVDATGATV